MTMMNENPADLLPELLLLGAAVLGLLAGLFLPRRRQWAVAVLCAVGPIAGLVAAALPVGDADLTTFDAFAIDPITHAVRLTVLGATLLVLALAAGPMRGNARETEAYVLILLASLGTIAMAAASDLLVFVAAYLLASIPAYALAGFAKDARGTEASMKYFLMGALLGIVMLAGVTLLYGVGGGTSYETLREGLGEAPGGVVAVGVVALFAGVSFKAGAVPAHHWVPDVTEGAPPVVAAFVTTVPKVGALAAAFRIAQEVLAGTAVDWRLLVAVVAAGTMTLGNLAAFAQTNVRRLLAYSTISQAGYLLVPVAVAGRTDLAEPALLFYLAAYAVTNVGAFAVVVAWGGDELSDHAGLVRRSPALALSLAVCLLGLIGTPPTAVFVGKVLAFAAAIDGAYTWLAVVAAVNTVASVFYYLRWIAPVFGRAPAERRPIAGETLVIACTAAVLSVVLGIGSGVAFTLG
ncbi:NADH-quinone oxidoreductase subunit N [Thermomonospora umbrina]|uniref:NADH-quinone oxidoreductase subunit N n=1 Tax=Thermomonospora umbrina TaxID=111806 RepID=A0A3D9SVP1_9ACTN|nr:NADH-quinone oxidoreductase subunit N [Thermomonospora umbrina]REE99878.1 NADH-quinone oxidoreductase subunit N [Thermomonospora umbrina]